MDGLHVRYFISGKWPPKFNFTLRRLDKRYAYDDNASLVVNAFLLLFWLLIIFYLFTVSYTAHWSYFTKAELVAGSCSLLPFCSL